MFSLRPLSARWFSRSIRNDPTSGTSRSRGTSRKWPTSSSSWRSHFPPAAFHVSQIWFDDRLQQMFCLCRDDWSLSTCEASPSFWTIVDSCAAHCFIAQSHECEVPLAASVINVDRVHIVTCLAKRVFNVSLLHARSKNLSMSLALKVKYFNNQSS